MSQDTRAQLVTLLNSKVLTGGNQTTAQNLRDVYNGIITSMINILDDKDQNSGYLGINSSGYVDVTKIKKGTPTGEFLRDDGTWVANGGGSVTTVSVVTNQGISGVVANASTTPAITLSIGALTGITSVNGLVITPNTGVVTTGTWNASVIGTAYGGTGIANNAASTITISGNFATTFTLSAITSVTLPTSGTLYGTQTGSITSAQLLNSLTNPTGTGVAVFGTAPTFTTSITVSGTGAITTFNDGTSKMIWRAIPTIPSYSGIFLNETPSATNAAIYGDGSGNTFINGSTSVYIAGGTSNVVRVFSSSIVFTPTVIATSATTNFTFTTAANTVQSAGVNIPNFKVNGSIKSWSAATVPLQYFNWFTTNTTAANGASSFTLVANGVFDYVQGGTNATNVTSAAIYVPTLALTNTTTAYGVYVQVSSGATNNYGFGTNGNAAFGVGGADNYIYLSVTPSATNFILYSDSGQSILNSPSNTNSVSLRTGNNIRFIVNGGFTTGTQQAFRFLSASNTGQTASTAISGWSHESFTRTWANGGGATTITTQKENDWQSVTYATSGGGTLAFTNIYGNYFNAPTLSGVTASYNYAAGFAGSVAAQGRVFITDTIGSAPLGYDLEINKTANGEVSGWVRNTNSSTAAFAQFAARTNSTQQMKMGVFSSGYTTAGLFIPSGAFLLTVAADSLLIGHQTSTKPIIFVNGGTATTNEVMRIAANLNVAISGLATSILTSPTAYLHLAAGVGGATVSSAPLKFTSGTNLTTAETGAIEYNGTNLFFTPTGTTRLTVNCSSSGASAPTTNAIGVILDYYGTSATRVLTTPDSWELVNIGGTNYKRPLYL